MGNVTGAALASMNAVEILIDQGHLDRSRDALIEVRRVLGAAGYAAALSYAELLSGVVALRSGDLDQAIPILEKCSSEFRDGSMLLYALESELRLAEAWVQLGRTDDAAVLAERALSEAESLSRRGVVVARTQRLLGMIALAAGDSPATIGHLSNAAETCRENELRYELAVTLRALAAIDPQGSSGAEPEANLIFDELGVIELGRVVGLVPTPASVSSLG